MISQGFLFLLRQQGLESCDIMINSHTLYRLSYGGKIVRKWIRTRVTAVKGGVLTYDQRTIYSTEQYFSIYSLIVCQYIFTIFINLTD